MWSLEVKPINTLVSVLTCFHTSIETQCLFMNMQIVIVRRLQPVLRQKQVVQISANVDRVRPYYSLQKDKTFYTPVDLWDQLLVLVVQYDRVRPYIRMWSLEVQPISLSHFQYYIEFSNYINNMSNVMPLHFRWNQFNRRLRRMCRKGWAVCKMWQLLSGEYCLWSCCDSKERQSLVDTRSSLQ